MLLTRQDTEEIKDIGLSNLYETPMLTPCFAPTYMYVLWMSK